MSNQSLAAKTLTSFAILGYLHEKKLLEQQEIRQVVSHLNAGFQAFVSIPLEERRRTAFLNLHRRTETACRNPSLNELKKLARELGGFIRNYNRDNPSKCIPEQIITNLQSAV